MKRPRSVTVIVQPDGALESRSYRLPVWMLQAATAAAALIVVFLLAIAILYGPVFRLAARVPRLESEVARLRAENGRVQQLAAALDSAEARYAQVRQMIGVTPAPATPDPSPTLRVAPPIRARLGETPRFETGASKPSHWPLDDAGYLTRGQSGGGARDEAHPGIDIAVPIGSVVRAAGGGTVIETGEDAEYGLFVVVQHPEQYRTKYGHFSRVLVTSGQSVEPGAVLGLSGNSGRSSAPHLHFEIRRADDTVDPLSMVKEDR